MKHSLVAALFAIASSGAFAEVADPTAADKACVGETGAGVYKVVYSLTRPDAAPLTGWLITIGDNTITLDQKVAGSPFRYVSARSATIDILGQETDVVETVTEIRPELNLTAAIREAGSVAWVQVERRTVEPVTVDVGAKDKAQVPQATTRFLEHKAALKNGAGVMKLKLGDEELRVEFSREKSPKPLQKCDATTSAGL